jgi:uncharacterized protein
VKILGIADHIDPIVYSSGLRDRFGDVDVVVGAGDLPTDYLDFICTTLGKPLVFVFGNHNLTGFHDLNRSPDFEDRGRNWNLGRMRGPGGIYIDRRVVRVKGLLIAGLGGSPWYNGGDNQFTERSMFLRALHLVPGLLWNRLRYGRALDVLVTHAAPFGVQDGADRAHIGFRTFLWVMRRFKPRYLIHGHVHLWDRNQPRVSRYCETTVINAYDHVLVAPGETPDVRS